MSESVDKISFDKMDFKFKAAYNQYSSKFDEANTEGQEELNELIKKLHKDKIQYNEFYASIANDSKNRYKFHQTKISTSRKFAYRKKQQKANRIARHK